MNMPSEFQDQVAGFVELVKPGLMIETGVQTGAASRAILSAMDRVAHGRLISIDPFSRHNLTHPRWTFHEGLSFDWLPKIYRTFHDWDIFLHDSDHAVGCTVFEYEFTWRCLKPGGYLLTDDHNWNQEYKVWSKFLVEHEVSETLILGSVRGCQKPMQLGQVNDITRTVDLCSKLANAACVKAGLPEYLPTRIYAKDYLLNIG